MYANHLYIYAIYIDICVWSHNKHSMGVCITDCDWKITPDEVSAPWHNHTTTLNVFKVDLEHMLQV